MLSCGTLKSSNLGLSPSPRGSTKLTEGVNKKREEIQDYGRNRTQPYHGR